MAGQKRKAFAEAMDSGSESDGDDRHHQAAQHAGAAPAAGPAGGAPSLVGGLDIYRMRRKQAQG